MKETAEINYALPEDNYVAKIKSFEPVKLEGTPAIQWTFEVTDGMFKGSAITKISRIGTSEGRDFLRKELTQKLGIELPSENADAREVAKQVMGMNVKISRKHVNDFWQTYIVGVAMDEDEFFF